VVGICNGFQILCESRLLPGALVRNRDLRFVCQDTLVRVESLRSPFTRVSSTGCSLKIPVAHGEGCYFADPDTLRELRRHDQILLRYVNAEGALDAAANPNGSLDHIAGICNRNRNVFGLMPHPERACEARLGSTDGRVIFESILSHA